METKFTLAICCYKFERFIDEALDGAFAQTYRPLEIVISDDNSPDGTWERIKAKVASFVAEHKDVECRDLSDERFPQRIPPSSASLSIILNRNAENLGLARHENRLFELSHGDYIAFQSGDDVSMPDRMAKIAERITANPEIRCLHSGVLIVDAEGNSFHIDASFKKTNRGKGSGLPSILGAGAVYHRDVYVVFGPIGAEIVNEDHVLPLRANLLGEICYIDEPLVKYRKHGNNASGCFSFDANDTARSRLRFVYALRQSVIDLHTASINDLAPRRKISKLRHLVEMDVFIQEFLGFWNTRKDMRMWLFWTLTCNPSRMSLFFRRLLNRFI